MSVGAGTGSDFWGVELYNSGAGARDVEGNMVISGGQ